MPIVLVFTIIHNQYNSYKSFLDLLTRLLTIIVPRKIVFAVRPITNNTRGIDIAYLVSGK